MLDVASGEQIEALYKLIQIKGGKREEKYKSTDINDAIKYHKWYVKRYKEGLLLEILPQKKIYNWKEKTVEYDF